MRQLWRPGSLAVCCFLPALRVFLAPRLSIVLVTSPIPSQPSTELVDSVIGSFDLIDGLQDCRLIVVADGITIKNQGKPVWNQGKIDTETHEKYLSYIESLRSNLEISRTSQSEGIRKATVLGPLDKRVNFAHALLKGLEKVETDYVLVVQHDRVFSERFSMREVVHLLDQHPQLRYVGFPTVPDYLTYACSKYGSWVRRPGPEPQLIPCFMWYDSTHVCRRDQLAELIQQEVRPGEFIESSYGCRMLAEIRERAEEWTWEHHMQNYGVFLYRDSSIPPGRPLVRHVSGRSFVSREERIQRGFPAERPLISRKVKADPQAPG